MRTVEVKLYQFNELPTEKAKEKAREWMREGESQDFGAFGELFEPAQTVAEILGIDFDTKTVPLHRGTRQEPDIRYSGFWSQGDGASFVGRYTFKPEAANKIREEFPKDEKLHAIADGLQALYVGFKLLGKEPGEARITQDGNYVHKYTMSTELPDASENVTADDEERILELMRDFAQWIYEGLEEEYDYRTSDECLDETMIANEYEFTEDGERA